MTVVSSLLCSTRLTLSPSLRSVWNVGVGKKGARWFTNAYSMASKTRTSGLLTTNSNMSLLSSPPNYLKFSMRGLGNAFVGSPHAFDLPGHICFLRSCSKSAPPLSYLDYKANCESLRMVFFAVISTALVLDLLLRPLKSSYWSACFRCNNNVLLYCKGNKNVVAADVSKSIKDENPLESSVAYKKLLS